ncbi:MAG: DegT/DnrJ/EryC1/StrS family aminotransferase [Francisellaceae bacterium]|nr:DegT/DnrJ/EryC1/StrS family aminotransferase [Francisellaceae bacterium]
MKNIAFINLAKQQEKIRDKIDTAIAKVLDHGTYIMGPEVKEFENNIAQYTGAKHAISCSSGTDALSMALMALGVKAGDGILVPSFTFAATAETVALLGAIPVFVDVTKDTFNMCVADIARAIDESTSKGLSVKGIIPVDLFGQPADYQAIDAIAEKHNMWVLSDAAQSLGASIDGKQVGTFGICTATSFFPAKPLGCYGDGGCIFTDNDELAEIMRSIRVHGKGSDKYDNKRLGLNARLDTIQAAILIEKLNIFSEEVKLRNEVANYYSEKLSTTTSVPFVAQNHNSSWAQYTLLLDENIDRANVMAMLKEVGVPSGIYYPRPVHKQSAYAKYHEGYRELDNSVMLSKRVLSLPMHPYLSRAEQDFIIENLQKLLVA